MDSPRPLPAHRDLIQAAKFALRKDAHAGFETQAPHLRQILENLPPLPPPAAAPAPLSAEQATRQDLETLLDYLSSKWIAYHPAGSHEGAIHLDVADAPDVLTLTFSMYLWAQTTQILRFTIARVDQDVFLCWTLDQSALYEPSEPHAPVEPRPAIQGQRGSSWKASDPRGRLLTWLRRRGWTTSAIVLLVYFLVFGGIGAIVGSVLGGLWGIVGWGDVDAVLALGGTWAVVMGAIGAAAGLIFGLLEIRPKD